MSVYDDWSDDTKKERTPMNEEDAVRFVNQAFMHDWGLLRPEVRRLVTDNGKRTVRITIEGEHCRTLVVNRFGLMAGDEPPPPLPKVEKVVEPKLGTYDLGDVVRAIRDLAAATAANTAAIERANALNEVQLRAAAPSPAMPEPPPMSRPPEPSTTTWADFGESPK